MTKCLLRWKSVCFNWTTMLPKSVMMCSRFAYLLKSSNLKTRDVPRKRRKSRLAKDPAAQITGQKCIFLLLLLLMLTISKEQLGSKGRRSQGRRDGVMGSSANQQAHIHRETSTMTRGFNEINSVSNENVGNLIDA